MSAKRSTALNPELHRHTIRGAATLIADYRSALPEPQRTIVFLHGSPDSHTMWEPLITELPTATRYLAPDLPGFGDSVLPAQFELSLDNMADYVRDLLDTLGVRGPVTLAVTDFGGHYGLAFAAKYPDRVDGLIIFNTNFSTTYRWHPFARMYRVPVLGEIMLATTPKPMMIRSIKGFAPAVPDAYLQESYAAGFGSPSVRKAILRMYRARNSADFAGWEQKIVGRPASIPALVLWGDKDPFVSPAFAESFGPAQVVHFPQNSHWLPLEAPAAIADRILPWLAGQQAPEARPRAGSAPVTAPVAALAR